MSENSLYEELPGKLAGYGQEIARLAADAGRAADNVSLMAVSKFHPAEAVEIALQAGQRLFGENRVQEAKDKFPALKLRYPDLRLHLIGPLQTNKVKEIFGLFDSVDSLDRPKLADALVRARDEKGQKLPDLMIQINTGEEPQKAGILPAEADAFIRTCLDDLALPVKGLMCIPPADEEPSLHFALLRDIARRHDLAELSMGMSGDYDAAIAFGATIIRIGTGIFGDRR